MSNKFIVEIKGDGFVLSMQGKGNTATAKKYLAELYTGCTVKVYGTGPAISMDREG